MTEDNDDLDEETKNLLRQIAAESEYFDEEEVQFGELLKKMANDYLIVLKLKNRATTEPSGDSEQGEELSSPVREKQASMKKEILENI